MRSKYELKAHKELELEGLLVDYKARPFRVPKGYQVDYFGLFDLITLDKIGQLRCIAIKGHGGVPKTLRDAITQTKLNGGITKEIWSYRHKGRELIVKKEIIE